MDLHITGRQAHKMILGVTRLRIFYFNNCRIFIRKMLIFLLMVDVKFSLKINKLKRASQFKEKKYHETVQVILRSYWNSLRKQESTAMTDI